MKLNNKGATLVEVLAGFTLLVVLVTSFVKIIKLSSELTTAAVDNKKNSLEFEENYYKTTYTGTPVLPKSPDVLKISEIGDITNPDELESYNGKSYVLAGVTINRIVISNAYIHKYIRQIPEDSE